MVFQPVRDGVFQPARDGVFQPVRDDMFQPVRDDVFKNDQSDEELVSLCISSGNSANFTLCSLINHFLHRFSEHHSASEANNDKNKQKNPLKRTPNFCKKERKTGVT